MAKSNLENALSPPEVPSVNALREALRPVAADGLRDQSRAMVDALLRETADAVQALPAMPKPAPAPPPRKAPPAITSNIWVALRSARGSPLP